MFVQNIREENEKLVEERFQKEREKMTKHLADEKVRKICFKNMLNKLV